MRDPTPPTADELLFGRGLTVNDNYIDTQHGFDLICFTNSDGRNFDLRVSDDRLHAAAVARLKSLGVRVLE